MTRSGGSGLSIVIVSWNAGGLLGDCLRSILAHPPQRACEILVVDNGSTDGSASIARGISPNLTVVELGANRGFAGACNEGLRRSSHDYVLLLNSDARARAASLETLCRFLDARPEAAAAGGALVGPDGNLQRGFNVRGFPSVASSGVELLLLDKLWPGNPVTRRQRMLDFDPKGPARVDQPAGACLILRKSALAGVGYFDEAFHPAWFEDVDLCRRLSQAGRAVFFLPEAVFDHRGGASLVRLGAAEFLSIFHRNQRRYFAKHHGFAAVVMLRALTAVGMAERMLAALVGKSPVGPPRKKALAVYWRVLREALWTNKVLSVWSSLPTTRRG